MSLDEINEVDFKLHGINTFGKSVQIRSFFWFAFSRIWTDSRIQTECGKIRTRKNSVVQDNISDPHSIADP